MASATDYLTVGQAKVDLRLDDGTFEDDATLERYIREAVAMVSGIIGRDLLEAEDIDPAMTMLVSAAVAVRFEGSIEPTSALYALAAPYRVPVSAE